MTNGSNKMDNKNEEQFILMNKKIVNNKQECKAEMKDVKEDIKDIKETLNKITTFMMNHTNISESSPTQKDKLTPLDSTTVVPTLRIY